MPSFLNPATSKMKGASNVQTHPMDFEKILVSNFARSPWTLGEDQALGRLHLENPQKPLELTCTEQIAIC